MNGTVTGLTADHHSLRHGAAPSRPPGLPGCLDAFEAPVVPGRPGQPGLRERGGVLSRVAADAERALAGSGRLVLVRGATGTGRSALLEAVVARAERQGFRVLQVRCSPEESGTDFAAVTELLDTDLWFGPRPTAVGSGSGEPGGEHSLHGSGRSAELWRRLRSYAARGPLLLAVDDVHLADPASRAWIARAARLIDRLPVLVVLTERCQYDLEPARPSLVRALPPHLFTAHRLDPLTPRAVAGLVRERLGAGLRPGWLDGCLRATGGIPLLLGALLEDLAALPGAAADVGGPFPPSAARFHSGAYTGAVSWALECAGPATADLARILAELETTGDTALLAEVAGTDPVRTDRWVAALRAAGLVVREPHDGRPRIAHPLLREAVLDGWPLRRRQDVRRAAAELLYHRGESAETVARRLLALPAVGAEWAVAALLEAASAAVRDGRHRAAGDCLRRVLDEPLSRERRGRVLTELGCLEADAGRLVGVRHLAEAVPLRQPEGFGRLSTTVALGTALARGGDVHGALDTLRALCEELPGSSAQARAAQAAAALLAAYDAQSWLRAMRGLRHVAAHSPDRLDQAERALLVRYEATAGLISAQDAMERLCALSTVPADPVLAPYALATAVAVLQWADRYDEVDRLVATGLSEYRPAELHPALHALTDVRHDAAAARGRYAELLAEPVVRAALAEPWRGGPGGPGGSGAPGGPGGPARPIARHGTTNLLAHTVLALLETGRREEARRLSGTIAAGGPCDSWEWNRYLYARGLLRAADGDHAGALADFRECGRRQSGREVLSPVVTPWRSAAAESLRRLGRSGEALELAEEEYRLARVWNTPRTVGRALRVLGTVTGGRRGTELNRRAVTVLRSAPAGAELGLELAPALIALGEALAASGERGRARTVLREAAVLAEELGALRTLARAERALADSGARVLRVHSGVDALTESERRIAGLAAEGRTNAEICELLHLARRTVETHLTSAYRKLGIRRRSELPTALAPLAETRPTPRPER
ncbi:helix-turn-helix transcriptional regulator [Streptomyces zingiberis]|uniref:AAA family ATPase n=1 Tax=Streptomyces zingiberis TaxID=2053010 RepID=A0ABX1C041_9ACTN|nr:LuxR family transcriptional regulator [Streptomyces zingiberis]NJQ03286.1 AAA family ATPase [Streptomyces zingiberis]